jgi:hypothetical protein
MALVNSIPRQYDPKSVILQLGGAEPTDVAPDTMYVLSKEEDRIMPSVGVLGEVALARNRNNVGTLTISLKQTSPMNQTFLKWYLLENASGIHFFDVQIDDPASGLKLNTGGWIQNQPDFTLGKEVSQLDWVIGLANVEFVKSDIVDFAGVLIETIKEGTVL